MFKKYFKVLCLSVCLGRSIDCPSLILLHTVLSPLQQVAVKHLMLDAAT